MYKRRPRRLADAGIDLAIAAGKARRPVGDDADLLPRRVRCLLYTSDAADDLLCVDLGGRRIISKKSIDMIRYYKPH